MAHFTPEFAQFFKELEENNHRDWFQENKKRYETAVKKPFSDFIGLMIDRLQELDPRLLITPKDAIFRIYRDVRFSKDKVPYKNHASANLSVGGRKDMLHPGVYLQFNHQSTSIYSGLYRLEPKILQKLREHIAANLDEFNELVEDADFVEKFGAIQGEKNKRIPKEFQEIAKQQPLIANKSFYYFVELSPKLLVQDDLADQIIDYYRVSRPLGKFLEEGVSAD